MNLPFFIARRYLVKQKGAFSTFIIRLAILATALSVAVMIMALAVVSGFREAISEKLFSFMGHVQIRQFNETGSTSFGSNEPILATPQLFNSLKKAQHVKAVYPYVIRPVIIQANGLLEGLQMKGIDPTYRFDHAITTSGASISFQDSAYSRDMLLSRTTAEKLNINIGDSVLVNFIDQSGPRIRKMRISGLYHSGMEDMDKFYAVCDIRLLQRINNWPADSINGYQLVLDAPENADTVASYIYYSVIEAPVAVYTTTETYTFIFDWLQIQGVNSTVLIVIMTIVAIINLAAALIILIVDRSVMIGLLKAMGMPYDSLRSIFLCIAAIVGGAGIFLGNVMALGMYWIQTRYGVVKLPENSYYMRYAPVKLSWWDIVAVDAGTLVLCLFCMWLPTLYIRRVQPSRVLQFK